MVRPKDEKLYSKVKKEIYKKMPKNSAYRSGLLVKKYKEEYRKKHKKTDFYTQKKTKEGLTRWFKEKWKNQRGGVGYKKKGDIYRPTKKISKKTPKTFNELSKKRINKARKEKIKKGRVKKF